MAMPKWFNKIFGEPINVPNVDEHLKNFVKRQLVVIEAHLLADTEAYKNII